MDVLIATITARRRLKSGPSETLLREYLKRASHYGPIELLNFHSEAELAERLQRERARMRPHVILLDSHGEMLSSEAIAARLAELRDRGTQQIWFALGPADGWSAGARGQANSLLSLGAITLPHELCLVVLAEQIYRAHTILAGHPYHSRH